MEEKNFSYTREVKDGELSGLITVRGNDKKEFLDNLSVLDEIIEKRQMVARPPKTNGYTKPSVVQTDKTCEEHGVSMQSAVSKKTGKPYNFHKNADGEICFGRGYQSKSY